MILKIECVVYIHTYIAMHAGYSYNRWSEIKKNFLNTTFKLHKCNLQYLLILQLSARSIVYRSLIQPEYRHELRKCTYKCKYKWLYNCKIHNYASASWLHCSSCVSTSYYNHSYFTMLHYNTFVELFKWSFF